MPGSNHQDDTPLSDDEAWLLAASWGSYIHAGDPGACLYGFGAGGSAPQDPEHRDTCIAHLDRVLLPLVRSRIAGATASEEDRDDLRELTLLRQWLSSWSDTDLAAAGETTEEERSNQTAQ